jgi:segregation and condensation protein B
MEFKQLKNILEAALLASSTPMSIHRLASLFDEGENVGNGEIGRALESLGTDCEERGVELVEVASGYRYQVRQDVHDWVAKMWTERPSRYSRAQLETLALIAYRQPITRGEIEAVRGVSVSSNIIKTLEEREWIRVVGHRDVPGRPALFGTTREFLDYFNLKSLDELPSLAEIRDMESFDPELNLDGEATPARASMPGDKEGEDTEDAGNEEVAQESNESAKDLDADTDTDRDVETNGDTDNGSVIAQQTDDTEAEHAGDEADMDRSAADHGTAQAEASDTETLQHPSATAEEAQAPATDDETVVADEDTEENRA